MADAGRVEAYRFTDADLRADARTPGISAFMRIKNGADFLEATIRSHIDHVDEIVAVHNQCTDATPHILARLAAEFGPERLRVFHYVPPVFAPGSEAHARTPGDSPSSFVNMSNFALTATRHRVVMKLDDDHLAIAGRFAALAADIRAGGYRLDRVVCFSGLNFAKDETGACGILASEPFSGNGDIGFFEVTPRTRFIHKPRFEDFDHDGKRRVFGDFVYWHLKHLKAGFGFANRDIEAGNARFARKRERFLANRQVIPVAELARRKPAWMAVAGWLPLGEKHRLVTDRWRRLETAPPEASDLARQVGCAGPSV